MAELWEIEAELNTPHSKRNHELFEKLILEGSDSNFAVCSTLSFDGIDEFLGETPDCPDVNAVSDYMEASETFAPAAAATPHMQKDAESQLKEIEISETTMNTNSDCDSASGIENPTRASNTNVCGHTLPKSSAIVRRVTPSFHVFDYEAADDSNPRAECPTSECHPPKVGEVNNTVTEVLATDVQISFCQDQSRSLSQSRNKMVAKESNDESIASCVQTRKNGEPNRKASMPMKKKSSRQCDIFCPTTDDLSRLATLDDNPCYDPRQKFEAQFLKLRIPTNHSTSASVSRDPAKEKRLAKERARHRQELVTHNQMVFRIAHLEQENKELKETMQNLRIESLEKENGLLKSMLGYDYDPNYAHVVFQDAAADS